MSTVAVERGADGHREFRHEAFVYRGEREFLDGTSTFIGDGVAAGEPVLVVVAGDKIRRLREHMGRAAAPVHFADMAEVGRNPARIIPAWREFVDAHQGTGLTLRGIGEPIGPERTDDELAECERHEALLNLAFAGGPGLRLLCPYDRDALEPSVIDEACRNHPFVTEAGDAHPSAEYLGLDRVMAALDGALPDPPATAVTLAFDGTSPLSVTRAAVAAQASLAGLDRTRADDLVLAVNELATNSLRHGGGRGTLRIWDGGGDLVCEVRDQGVISEPLVGRERPRGDRENGRGMWLVNQLCDLVQVRTGPAGSVVRLHIAHPG